jgi:type VI secretion system secreted protein VgrG
MFTQKNRLLSLKTPLGADELLLAGFSGTEGISMPFVFELELLSENDEVNFRDIIGEKVTVTIELADGEKHYVNGFVSHFAQVKTGGNLDQAARTATYKATMISWLWFLTRTVNSRIFQELSVVQIIEKVFKDRGFHDFQTSGLTGSYQPREYCVQYHETDFGFVSRLMEEEGIFYFFKHEDGKHTLVLADSSQEHKPCPHQDQVRCQQNVGSIDEEDVITELSWSQEIRYGKFTLKDYNYLSPSADLKAEAKEGTPLGPGEREFYDYPGGHATRDEADRLANLRMQAEEVQVTTVTGASNCRAFASGFRFTLKDYQRKDMNDKPYVLATVSHSASESVTGSNDQTEVTYSNSFVCIPFDVPYRPPVVSPKPVIPGVQTAVVTGPSGEEIYTDDHGRVKVQFHWDREGKNDDKTTCWIRVAQMWAGQGWGAVWIPRIGHEVVVSFLEGDPDRPLVVGSVYNGLNTVPYKLPTEMTKSTIKSNSSKGGAGFNELRFEDKKGQEQIFVQAEKDMDTVIKANETRDVGGDRKVHVKGHFTENIDSGETRTVNAGMGETINAGMTQTINGGETRTVNGGVIETLNGGVAQTVTGGEARTISGGVTENISGGETRTVAGGLTETVTGSITQNVSGGITINSPAGYTVIAPGGTRTVDSWFTKIGGKDEDLFAVQTAILIMQNTYTAITTAFNGLKAETTGAQFERIGFKNSKEGAEFKNELVKIANAAQRILDAGLTIIGL